MEELNNFIANNNISLNKQNTLKKLFDNNENLLRHIRIDFINSDYFDKLDFNLLQAIVSLDENVQLDFLKISGNKRDLFYEIINRFSKKYYQFPFVNALLNNFNNGMFENFLNGVDIKLLNDEDLLNICYLLTAKENTLNVNSIDDIRNIDNILEQKIKDAKNDNNIEDYKNYTLLKKINLSLPEVKLICQKYCYDLDHFHVDEAIINDLKCLKKIVLSKSIDEIEQLINNLNIKKMTYPDFQTICQNLYEVEFNSVLFNSNNIDYKEYDGVKLIDAGTKFNMVIRANGIYSDSSTVLGPKEYWNKNIRDTLSFSTSLLSNNYMRNVSFFGDVGYVIGFANIPKNSMVQCCMGDDATIHVRRKTLDARSFDDNRKIHPNTGDACGQQFRPLPEMIKHGAGEYQEVTLERFSYNNDKEERIQPSYIVYFKKNEEYKNSEDFKRSLEAAKSFGIPIVVIDVKKVIKSEKEEIEKLLKSELSIDNILEVIRKYVNIINSFSTKQTKNIVSETLLIDDPKTAINNMVKNYIMFLEQKKFDKDFYQKLFDELMILNDEKNCINVGTLIQLKNNNNLISDFEKYNEIIYGITYKEHSKYINSQYNFEETEKIYDYIISCGLKLDAAVYENDSINSIVNTCKRDNIPLTQEIISYNWEEFLLYLKRNKIIKQLNENPTQGNINDLFDLFSNEEIEQLLQPIINRIIDDGKGFLIEQIKEKLREKNLEDKFFIPSDDINNELEDFDSSAWDNIDWDNFDFEDSSTSRKK